MKKNEYNSFDIFAFYKKEILSTRIAVGRVRQEVLSADFSRTSIPSRAFSNSNIKTLRTKTA